MDLGLERAGMTCKWQVEIDPWCRRVLEKHWPNVSKYGDIREVKGEELEPVDLIAGGFPCQDVSRAGKQIGIDAGERSGLWREFARLVGEVRPRYVLVENVTGLLDGGIGRVLGDLAALGFDAEWEVLSACSVGAPQTRQRVFIVAYPCGSRLEGIYEAARRINLQPTTTHLRRQWETEPEMDRLANGIRASTLRPRLTALGNAVVPQVSQWIGERIMEATR